MDQELLIVEDDDGIRRLMRSTFDDQYGVETAADGRTAWQALVGGGDDPPDAVLLDVMLPDLDGFTLLRRIRDHATLGDLPVVVVSARSREEDVRRALKAGATDFVTKPFEPEELHGTVRRAVTDDGSPVV